MDHLPEPTSLLDFSSTVNTILQVNPGLLTIIIIFIIFSAFFSMSETALNSISEAKVKTLIESRVTGSRKTMYCIENYDRTLTTILVGNNIVNTAMSVLAVTFFASIFTTLSNDQISLVATIVMTIVLLTFGEILPKTIGKKFSEKIAVKVGPIIWALSYVLYPIVIPFRLLQKLVTGKNKESNNGVDESELGSILDTMEEEGSIESDEREMIKNVFDLNDQTVEDIMVPRIDMVAIDVNASVEEAENLFFKSAFSRVPVYEEDKDHIVGILYERDFYSALLKNKDNVSIKNIMRKAKFVNKTLTVDKLIRELQISKVHMAIVSGEYNDTLGLVTMEDALEELVGEIYDEHDEGSVKNTFIHPIEENVYIVDGDCGVDELFEELNIGDCPDETKVSSWIFESHDDLPKVGDVMVYIASYTKEDEEGNYKDFAKKLTFEVVRVQERRIEKVRLTVSDATEEEVEEYEEEKEDSD